MFQHQSSRVQDLKILQATIIASTTLLASLAMVTLLNTRAPKISGLSKSFQNLEGFVVDVSFDKKLDTRLKGRSGRVVTILVLRYCSSCTIVKPAEVVKKYGVDYVYVPDSHVTKELAILEGVIVRSDLMMTEFPPEVYDEAPMILHAIVGQNNSATIQRLKDLPLPPDQEGSAL